jgi:hypothetical protein
MVSKNKKGFSTLMLFVFVIVGIVLLVLLGVVVYSFNLVDDSFSMINFTIGNSSFQDVYNQTLQIGVTSLNTTMPALISTAVLLGMVLVMMLVGYNMAKISRLWMLLDIALIIGAEILAVAISDSFTTFINSSPEMLAIFSTTLSPSARYIINLPIIVPVVGALIMLTTYLTTTKKEETPRSEF